MTVLPSPIEDSFIWRVTCLKNWATYLQYTSVDDLAIAVLPWPIEGPFEMNGSSFTVLGDLPIDLYMAWLWKFFHELSWVTLYEWSIIYRVGSLTYISVDVLAMLLLPSPIWVVIYTVWTLTHESLDGLVITTLLSSIEDSLWVVSHLYTWSSHL